MAFQESIAILKQRLREMWGEIGDAASRDYRAPMAGSASARLYALGRGFKP